MKIGFLNFLTVLFVFGKVAEIGAIASWSWWLVLLPSIISFGVAFLLAFLAILVAAGR